MDSRSSRGGGERIVNTGGSFVANPSRASLSLTAVGGVHIATRLTTATPTATLGRTLTAMLTLPPFTILRPKGSAALMIPLRQDKIRSAPTPPSPQLRLNPRPRRCLTKRMKASGLSARHKPHALGRILNTKSQPSTSVGSSSTILHT